MRPHWFYYFTKIGLGLLSILLIPICWLNSIGKRKRCPPIDNPILLHSAKKLSHLIRTKQLSCEEVIRAYIKRAEEVNKITNAIVENRFEKALKEAIDVDKLIAENKKSAEEFAIEKPLLGVPISIKESLMVKGMSCNVGCAYWDRKGDKNAYVVQQILNAGAIITCVTNTPEHCMFWESYNKKTGVTRNPYDTRRTAGGSSGGEAALISSGGSLIGLGSDLAGSLRMPALFTGIFSHKGTHGSIPIDGFIPSCKDSNYSNFIIAGPLARYAEDLPLVLSTLVGPEKKEMFTNYSNVGLSNLKVYYMEKEYNSWFGRNVDESILNAMKSFIEYLKTEHKVNVQKVNIEEMCHTYTRSLQMLLSLDKIECQFLDKENNFKVGPEIWRFITFRSKTTIPVLVYGLAKRVYYSMLQKRNWNVFTKIDNMKLDFKNLLADNGILIYPTWIGPAHYHYEMFYKIIDFGYCSIFNLLGLPVSNVPAGFTNSGLPIGFQIVANANQDQLTLAVAQEAEKYFGGWKPPKN